MRTTTTILPAALVLALASGCGSSPPTTYHVLSALPGEPAASGSAELETGVLVVAVSGFPQYLDRRELTHFRTPGTLALDEQHFWAEPLNVGFARTLAEDLTALGHPAIPLGTLSRAVAGARTLAIEVTRCDTYGTEVVVAATWTVGGVDGSSGPVRRVHFTAGPEGEADSPAAIADALSAAVGRLASEIAEALAQDD